MSTYLIGAVAIGAAAKASVRAPAKTVAAPPVQQAKAPLRAVVQAPAPALRVTPPVAAPQPQPVIAQIERELGVAVAPQLAQTPQPAAVTVTPKQQQPSAIAQVEKELGITAAPSRGGAQSIPQSQQVTKAPAAAAAAAKPIPNVNASLARSKASGQKAVADGKKRLKAAKTPQQKASAQAAIDAGNKAIAASSALASAVSKGKAQGVLVGAGHTGVTPAGGWAGITQDVTQFIIQAQSDADAAAQAAEAADAALQGAAAPGSIISPANPSVIVNNRVQLTAIDPQGSREGGWTWKSSDTSIAEVDSTSGLAEGLAPGTATITATNHEWTATTTLTVTGRTGGTTTSSTPPAVPTAPAITPQSSQIAIGGRQAFQVVASGAPPSGVWTWTTSNPSVASVDSTGAAFGLAVGTALITATQGSVSLSASLTVYDPSQQAPAGGYGGGSYGGGAAPPDDGGSGGGGPGDDAPPDLGPPDQPLPSYNDDGSGGATVDDSGGGQSYGTVADGMSAADLLALVQAMRPGSGRPAPQQTALDDSSSETGASTVDDFADSVAPAVEDDGANATDDDDSGDTTMLGTYMLGCEVVGASFTTAPSLADVRAGNGSLKSGMKGDAVTYVQRALGSAADSEFGPNTESAVKSFQTYSSLPATGVVDKATIAAIDAMVAQSGAGAPLASASTTSAPAAPRAGAAAPSSFFSQVAPSASGAPGAAPVGFLSRPIWQGAGVKWWQGIVSTAGMLLLGTGIAVAARRR